MCNLAGYIGNRRAAPILFEMLKAQEGFGGGAYSGIATVHDGVLHWAKVVGDAATLLEQTDAWNFPGTTGIIHGRPKLGGDREWAHPFLDERERFAYVANGHTGIFGAPDQSEKRALIAALSAEGAAFKSSLKPKGEIPAPDELHLSEVMCRLISREYGEGRHLIEAVIRACSHNPGELASLLVDAARPGELVAARFSQPLMMANASGETFLATSALAFDSLAVDSINPFPILSVASVGPESFTVYPMRMPSRPVANALPWSEGEARVFDTVAKTGGATVEDCKQATANLWSPGEAPQKDMMVYELLRALHQRGRILFRTEREPGVIEGTTLPVFKACLR